MPDLDLSDLVVDPDFADTFDVVRRRQVLTKGRKSTQDEVFQSIVGVVTQQDPSELMRREEGQLVPRTIMVVSQFRFFPACRVDGVDYEADLIRWDGNSFLVKQVYPYHRFGEGFYEVVAESPEAMDRPH